MHPPPPRIPAIDAAASTGRTLVKVCGFRDGANLRETLATGVDAIGLNFWPGSKRHVEPTVAANWLDHWPESVLRVGVFVLPDDALVLDLFASGLIHAAQLHGGESPEQCRRLMAAGIPVIKAFGLRTMADWDQSLACGTPYLLVDAFAPGVFGGTGRTVDWAAVRAAWNAFPDVRLILSGGLHPGNVAAAVATVRPVMVDAASGVESSPGIKDAEKSRAFVRAARSA